MRALENMRASILHTAWEAGAALGSQQECKVYYALLSWSRVGPISCSGAHPLGQSAVEGNKRGRGSELVAIRLPGAHILFIKL